MSNKHLGAEGEGKQILDSYPSNSFYNDVSLL